jgi:hypothetical protein
MSCLFDSLSFFLKKDSYEIRQIICDYLENNNKIHEDLETKFILQLEDPNYIEKMRKPETWGGSNEISACCNIWKLKILVFTNIEKNQKIEFLPLDTIYNNVIALFWSNDHYEPVKMFLYC